MAHAALSRKTSTSLEVTDLAILSSAMRNICARTSWMHSNIAFACGFLTMVGLRLIPYDFHTYSKFSLNYCIVSNNIVGIYSTRFNWLIGLCNWSFYQRSLQQLMTLYRWLQWSLVSGLKVIPQFLTNWMRGWSLWESRSLWLCHPCL